MVFHLTTLSWTLVVINLGVDCIAPLVIGLLTQSTYFVCKKVRTDFTPLYYGMKEKATSKKETIIRNLYMKLRNLANLCC